MMEENQVQEKENRNRNQVQEKENRVLKKEKDRI